MMTNKHYLTRKRYENACIIIGTLFLIKVKKQNQIESHRIRKKCKNIIFARAHKSSLFSGERTVQHYLFATIVLLFVSYITLCFG